MIVTPCQPGAPIALDARVAYPPTACTAGTSCRYRP